MKALDKILGSKDELKDQEYPEEFEPKEELIDKKLKELGPEDQDIKSFMEKKNKKEEKKDGKKNASQKDIPETKEQSPGTVPESLEESQEIEGTDQPERQGIVYTSSFNIPLNEKNIETAKKIITDNVEKGFVVAFQTGLYVNKDNVDAVKKALDYFVENGYKSLIVTEQTQEIADDK